MGTRRAITLGLAILLGLSGCLGSDPTPPARPDVDEGAGGPAPWWSSEPVLAIRSCEEGSRECFEPTVAAAADGTAFVTTHPGTSVYRVSATGAVEEGEGPPVVADGPEASDADALVTMGPGDRLFYVALSPPDIRLARSDDGGQTWALNRLVEVPDGSQGGADRPWLAFDGDTVHLVFTAGPGAGVEGWVLTSRDRGETFEEARRLWVPGTRSSGLPVGQPAVLADGTLVVPYSDAASPQPLTHPYDTASQALVRAAVCPPAEPCSTLSLDAAPPGEGITPWPNAAEDAEGNARVVWTVTDGDPRTIRLEAAGTVGEPQRLSTPGERSRWPGIVPAGEAVPLWFDETSGGDQQLVAWIDGEPVPLSPEIGSFRLGQGLVQANRNTEFAHATAMPDGGFVAVWSANTGVGLSFAHVGR